jgi:hypothetical protein
VIAVNERTAFTQFSRSVQPDLPEGILGEVSQVMRGPLAAGRFGPGLNDGVSHFIGSLARKVGFPAQDIDQVQIATAVTTEPVPTPSPAAEPVETVVKPASEEKLYVSTRPFRVNKPKEIASPAKAKSSSYVNTPEDDADEAEEVELVLTLPLAERPAKLKEFLEVFPNSKSRARAIELLISTYAGLGDQKLKDGDRARGCF